MARKGRSPRRKREPDIVYNSEIVSRLINNVLRCGKKSLAERIVYKSFEIIREKTKKEPLEVFNKAAENIMPHLEVKSRRVGGATYQVPVEVRGERRLSLGMRWLVEFARMRKGVSMSDKLSSEILDAYNNTGSSVKKKEDTHRMAEANKAFAHYRW